MSIKLRFMMSLVLAAFIGCKPASDGPAASDSSARENTRQSAGNAPLAVANTNRPDAVVSSFLDALRDGDDEIAESLLTTIARRETRAHELAVQPPGSPSARYEIGEVKHVQGGVHVNSTWREFDDAGEETVYDIVWVLREEPIGWRVAGMATAVNPAKPPIYLNFEDVPDLLQKWRQADEELAAQAEQSETLQAQQPAETIQR